VRAIKLIIVLLLLTFSSCNAYSEGPDLDLDMDQTGWACEHNLWNIWLYRETFNVQLVQAYFYSEPNQLGWYQALPESEENYYQKKFIDIGRQCAPYDVKYIMYFTDKEPEVVWMHWNESSE
jgi:hypothetical protein